MNNVEITGTLKNVRTIERGSWSITTGSFSKYGVIGTNGKRGCIVTTQVVFLDADLIAKAKEVNAESTIKITGRLVSNFDRRPNIPNDQRRASYNQVEVTSLEVTNPVLL